MAAQDVTVSIGIDTSAVKPGLDEVKGSFQGWAGNTNAVASATQKLEHQIRSFAQEQRSQARMAKFYANEITEMIPAAEGAKKAIQGLMGVGIEGLAGGIGFGFAMESIKLLVLGLEQVGHAAREAFAKADKEVSRVLEEWTKKADAMHRSLAVAMGGESAGIRFDLSGSIKQVNAEIAEARKSLDTLMFPWQRADSQKKLDELIEKRRKIVASAADVYSTERQVSAEKERQADATKAAIEADRERLRIAQEIEKAEQAIREFQAKGWERGEFPDMYFDQKVMDDMAFSKQQKIGAAAQQTLNERFAEGWQKGELPDLGGEIAKVNDESEKMKELWGSIGSSVSSAFTSIGNTIGGVAGKVLAWLGQMITQAIGLAVAMSAAGSAWTTPLGSLAIAGTVAAGLLALVSTVSARADGGPVQAFRPYLVGERGPELIVPSQSGTVIPNHQLGGGSVNVTFNAPVDAAWWRANERHIVRTLQDAARYRRGA